MFDRRAHSVKLTAAGRVLPPQLQSIMNSLAHALGTARKLGRATLAHPTSTLRFVDVAAPVVINLAQRVDEQLGDIGNDRALIRSFFRNPSSSNY
jgi:DNA-binding transcriptional LysR family regulator